MVAVATLRGFPVYGEAGVKLGRDVSGRFVTQETRSFEPNAEQTAAEKEELIYA